MKISLKHVGQMSFEAVNERGHRVVMSASAEAGGEDSGKNAGPRPMEMVLIGLGGCSGIDVALILKKSRQRMRDLAIDIEAERADTVPSVFTRIHLHYRISGDDLDHRKVERAVALSMEKYCSVTRMLEHTAAITHSVEITPPPASTTTTAGPA